MHGHLNVKHVARRQISPWWWCNPHKISGVLHHPFRMCRVISIARRVPGFDQLLCDAFLSQVPEVFGCGFLLLTQSGLGHFTILYMWLRFCSFVARINVNRIFEKRINSIFSFSFLTTNPNPKIRRSIQEAYHICTRENQMKTLKVR